MASLAASHVAILKGKQCLNLCSLNFVTNTGECVEWSKLIGMGLATTAYHCTISFNNLVKYRARSLSKLKSMSDTVDGQNPAPPRMMIIPLFIGF